MTTLIELDGATRWFGTGQDFERRGLPGNENG